LNRNARLGSIVAVSRISRLEAGQASVELLAAIPLVVAVAMLGWQLVLTGHTLWKANEAARVAAREVYVAEQRGEAALGRKRGRDAVNALLGTTPRGSRGLKVSDAGLVTVSARVPLVEPFRSALGVAAGPRVHASSRMRP
jgi:hypothetical protein